MPAPHENVLSLESFDEMLVSVKCNGQHMALEFEYKAIFVSAHGIWKCVNDHHSHTFLMIARRGDCANVHRTPHQVSSIEFDHKRNVAYLQAKPGEWKDLAHSYELRIGSPAMSSSSGLERRHEIITKNISLNLSHDFNVQNYKVSFKECSASITCDPCYSTGRLNFEFFIKKKYKIVEDVKFNLTPKRVKAAATFTINLADNFGSKINHVQPLAKIHLDPAEVPGVLYLGPVLEVRLGIDWTAIEGAVTFTTDATAILPDNAVLDAVLMRLKDANHSEWNFSLETGHFRNLKLKGSTTTKVYLELAPQLEIEAIGESSSVRVA